MKFIQLPMKPLPRQLTANQRPSDLGEMKRAFLNANNRRSWAEDEEYPEPQVRGTGWNFTSYRMVKEAIRWQQRSLKKKERRHWLETLPAKLQFDGQHRKSVFEESLSVELKAYGSSPEPMVQLYLESLRHAQDVEWLNLLHGCRYDRSTGKVTHPDDFRWDRGDKPSVFIQLMTNKIHSKEQA